MYIIKKLLKNKYIMGAMFILSCLYILLYFHIATTFDEKYTLLLINHKFSQLIELDSLDVHPPLYYIALRYFLIITTFWTKSIFVKIVFARILSLIFSIVTFVYICKIFAFYKLRFNVICQWILFILLPNVLGSYNPYTLEPLVDIRMYSLSAMLISMECYYLIRVGSKNDLYDYVIIILLSSLAMYTHYFAAIISVMMIIAACIINFRDIRMIKKLIISLILSITLYLPWLPFLYRQISIPKTETFNMNRIGTLTSIIKFIIICIILSVPIIWAKYHLNDNTNELSLMIIVTLILTLLFVSTVLLIIRPMFNLRYIYSIFLIYEFYSLSILFNYMIFTNIMYKIYIYCISLILLINVVWSGYYQLVHIDIPDVRITRKAYSLSKSKRNTFHFESKYSKAQLNPKINGNNHQYEIDETPINFEYAFLLSKSHKYINAPHLHNYFGINYKPAYKPLFKEIDSHIY